MEYEYDDILEKIQRGQLYVDEVLEYVNIEDALESITYSKESVASSVIETIGYTLTKEELFKLNKSSLDDFSELIYEEIQSQIVSSFSEDDVFYDLCDTDMNLQEFIYQEGEAIKNKILEHLRNK